jgi:hypothetical protein
MKPTPDDIEQKILSMAIPVGPSDRELDDANASCTPLWWVKAYDPGGNLRGIGTDTTLPAPLATAWILSHDEIANCFEVASLDVRDLDCVPRHVPDDWTFEIDNMPTVGTG